MDRSRCPRHKLVHFYDSVVLMHAESVEGIDSQTETVGSFRPLVG